MGRTIGIDLGTTNTAVAVFIKGRPKVLEDEKGYKVLPSVVCQKEDGSFVVGQAAKNRILTDPDNTVYAVKRLIGRQFSSRQAQDTARRMPFEITEGQDGEANVGLGEHVMTPAEVSAIILKVAKQIAERALGEEVEEAVITVPAYFNHAQRAATMEAAELAGLRCDRLLNEPTAAALAYGFRKDIERNVAIYDLGGGTFDVSVLHLSSGVYEVLATTGDTYLGGEDFDLRIVEWLADRFLAEHREDLREDVTALQRLKDAAERAKCELSFTDKVTVLVPRITPTRNLEYELTRSQLEELVGDLVDKTLDITQEAVAMAGLQINQLDDIVLVGGQTRMPRVREAISTLFGKEPSRSVHPEEVVAIGAAVHAQSLDEPDAGTTLLIDVTPFDLGIDSAGGFFTTLIERNTRIPFTKTRVFTTASEDQERVRITVRQGASRVAEECERLGEFVLDGLRAARRMERKIDVTFRIDANGMLHTTAVDRLTGERKQLVIRNYSDKASDPTLPDDDAIAAERAKKSKNGAQAPVAVGGTGEESKGGFFAGLFSGLTGGKKKEAPKKAKEAPPEEPQQTDAKPVIAIETPAPSDAPPEIPVPELPDPPPEAPRTKLSIELPTIDPSAVEPLDDAPAAVSATGFGNSPRADASELAAMYGDVPPPAPLEDFEEIDELEPIDDLEPLDELPDDALGYLAPPDEDSASPPDDPFDDVPDLPDEVDVDMDEELRPALLEEDLFYPEDLYSEPEPEPEPEPPPPPRKRTKKPARLKISYKSASAFVREYKENLKRGRTFIKAEKPLKEGRACVFEIAVPGLAEAVKLAGVVVWSSRRRDLTAGQEKGMEIEYRLTADEQEEIDLTMASLG
ncbi:MAG: Hsp70 family protein [Proteobacteria bacterium]|nr:Hsp70 family protein [Pseudomonadota bacterium]MCP4920229.1 Hsp70 family protein [Pseudomonadota bacterium]